MRRQLRKLKLSVDSAPNLTEWTALTTVVSDYYAESDNDRSMLSRTLELTTEEMGELRMQVEAERDSLRDLLEAVGSGIGYFAGSVAGDQVGNHEALASARIEFVTHIESLLERQSDGIGGLAGQGKIRDEFARLADSVIYLAQQATTKGKLEHQMELAGTVQRLMVPPDGVIESPTLSVSSMFRPAAYCGGDWWSFHPIDKHRSMLVVGDITGHGVASAVMAGAAKGACDAIAESGPEAILEAIQRLLYGPEKGRLAMTCAIAVIDSQLESIQLTAAGHPFPMIVDSNGGVFPLVARGAPLGILPDISSSTITAPMKRGDSLLLYTDGITECPNAKGQQFGDRRLRRAIQGTNGTSADALLKAIVQRVDEHRGVTEPDDDVTIIVAQRK
ncbi:MAG: serine/threonine-protein phosphatase [Myxococcales bacterium]|nr:serine/threonine-protein phosphatase [Myxococcales bacterium]